MHSDPTGEFSWVIVGVLVVCTLIGGILGYSYDEELGSQARQDKDSGYTKPMHPSQINKTLPNEDKEANTQSQEKSKRTSVKTKVKNTLIGAGLGLATGGALVALGGAIGTVAVGSGSTYIGLFGGTGLQTTALGAAIHNLFGMVVAPFFGVEMESIELTP